MKLHLGASKTQVLKKQSEESRKFVYENTEQIPFLKIEDGSNKFRLFPPHNPNDSFMELKKVVFMDSVDEKTGEKRKIPVKNAIVHGGLEKDLIEEYYRFALNFYKKKIEESQEEEEVSFASKVINIITGFKLGIAYNTKWVSYAKKMVGRESQFGILEFSNAIKKKIEELSVQEDENGDPIETDPFTDSEDGKAIIIKKEVSNSLKQGKTVEKTSYTATIEYKGDYSLEEKEIKDFIEVKPLTELRKSFKYEDFLKQVECLELYDKSFKLNIIKNKDFVKIFNSIVEMVEDKFSDVKKNENKKSETFLNKNVEKNSKKDYLGNLDDSEMIMKRILTKKINQSFRSKVII